MIRVSMLLQNVSNEIERLAQIAEGLDEIVGDLAASEKERSVPLSTRFQDIDSLRQALHAIAKVSMAAARDVPQESDPWLPKCALAAGVTLEQVRDACLRTEPLAEVPRDEEANSAGEDTVVSFFEEF